jgi:hypothetical protein
VKKIALAAALASAACASHMPAAVHTVRITDQGGVLRLTGDDLDEAAQAAVKTMKSECRGGAFTVTALEDAQGSPRVTIPGGGDYAGMTYVPAVWRELTYACGGPGKDSPLTARVLAWAGQADAADAARLAKEEARKHEYDAYPCGNFGVCAQGGICIDGMCLQ